MAKECDRPEEDQQVLETVKMDISMKGFRTLTHKLHLRDNNILFPLYLQYLCLCSSQTNMFLNYTQMNLLFTKMSAGVIKLLEATPHGSTGTPPSSWDGGGGGVCPTVLDGVRWTVTGQSLGRSPPQPVGHWIG